MSDQLRPAGLTGPGPWMVEWLTAFIESDPDVSERDLVVLDQIRAHLEAEVPPQLKGRPDVG